MSDNMDTSPDAAAATAPSATTRRMKKTKPTLKRTVSFHPALGPTPFESSSPSTTTTSGRKQQVKTKHYTRDDSSDTLLILRRSVHAKLPTHASLVAAGADLYAAESVTIAAWTNCAVSTGITVLSFPTNCYGRIAGRSGLALHSCLLVGAGVIDRDYAGIVKVVLFNCGPQPFTVAIGDRIAQLICESYSRPTIKLCLTTGVLSLSPDDEVDIGCSSQQERRGENGFGSTVQ